MNRRLVVGYRLHRLSRTIEYIPVVGKHLAERIRKLDLCRDYIMWSWSDY